MDIKNSKKELKVNDITPTSLFCIVGSCPAIFKTNNDTFIIIGKQLNKTESKPIQHKIGQNETAIEIPKELITKLFAKTE